MKAIFTKHNIGGFETDHFIVGELYTWFDEEYEVVKISSDIAINKYNVFFQKDIVEEDVNKDFILKIKSDTVFAEV